MPCRAQGHDSGSNFSFALALLPPYLLCPAMQYNAMCCNARSTLCSSCAPVSFTLQMSAFLILVPFLSYLLLMLSHTYQPSPSVLVEIFILPCNVLIYSVLQLCSCEVHSQEVSCTADNHPQQEAQSKIRFDL